MSRLLTQQDLAERWQVEVRTIEKHRKTGILTPCKNVPGIRFTEQHILELEGVKLEKFSPLERRRLEKENAALREENEELKGIISRILAETSKIIPLYNAG